MLPAQEATTTEVERAELETLSARLATRGSILHFAIAFGASFFCLIAAGISVKLGRDLAETSIWYLFAPVGALAAASLAVALRGFWRGQKLKHEEHAQFRRLLELRARAGLD